MTWASSWPAESLALTAELSTDPAFVDPPARKRQTQRLPVDLDAGLRQRGAAAVSVQVIDLSTDGFRATTHLVLEQGDEVWLRLPGIEASHARVMWRDGCYIGCAFERPLHPAVIEMIVSGGRIH